MASGGKLLSSSESDSDLVMMDTSDSQRKRHFADAEGFIQPGKFAKVKDVESLTKPIETSNSYEVLGETTQAGPSGAAAQGAKTGREKTRKEKRMPPIVSRLKKVETTMVNAIKNQTSRLIYFEYNMNDLKIRTANNADHKSVITFLKAKGIEFYTHDPNPSQQVKFILRGLPPSTDGEEIVTELREKGVEVTHVRQKRNVVEDDMRVVKLLPMWIVAFPKIEENIENFKSVTGIMNFLIRIQGYKASERVLKCFRCQNFGHKAEFCFIKERCVKCAGNHNTRECTKDLEPARCANCAGQHSANYQGCPEAIKFKERSGTTRTPTKPQLRGKPKLTSRTELPELPRRQRAEPNPPMPTISNGMEDIREVINLFKSGTISSYIIRFKELIGNAERQPDSFMKVTTFCLGVMEIFDD